MQSKLNNVINKEYNSSNYYLHLFVNTVLYKANINILTRSATAFNIKEAPRAVSSINSHPGKK